MRRGLLLIALLPLAAGCGAERGDVSDSASDLSTSRIEIEVGAGKDSFVGKGMLDFARDRGLLIMSSGPGGPKLPGGKMEVRFFGRTGYTGWTFDGHNRWLKESETPTGSDRFIPGLGGPDPQDLLSVLTKSSKEMEKLDDEEIRGVPSRHYRAHFDRKKLDENLPTRTDPVIDAWIDEAGVVRRLRVPDADGETVFDYFDFGVEVDVETPPADEVVSEDEFFKLVDEWCQEQPKDTENLFCGELMGETSGEGESEPVPAETVEK